MKRIIALVLVCIFVFSGCSIQNSNTTKTTTLTTTDLTAELNVSFDSLNDPNLLNYVEDSVYSDLVLKLNSDEYFVENISTQYISKEYLDELAYNSQSNIYFGFTLEELNAQFQGTKYVFTLGEDNKTTVKEFEAYDDTYEKAIKNVAIGAGVILVCVTVSAITGGAAPAVSLIFAASAKTGAIMVLSSGAISGVAAGVITGFQTKDFDQALKAAAASGSNGFKWGAISGALVGGVGEAISLHGATLNGLTMNQAAAIQKETKYPLDVIKQFKSIDEYNVYKEAGLTSKILNNKTTLVQNIDLKITDEFGRTNLQRMQQGMPPLDITKTAYQLHHVGQNSEGTLAILTRAQHMQGGNNGVLHNLGEVSKVSHGAGWQKIVSDTWKAYAKSVAV